MIKRKDGSYSPRGLWDNIRAKKGSGKKPTKEMLAAEKEVNKKEKKKGKTVKFQSGGKVSDSTKYFRNNPEARAKKNAYNKEYHSTPSRKKYRAELNRINRQAGTYGNGDGMDYDHGEQKFMSAKKNRSKK